MLWALDVILVVRWLAGVLVHVSGTLIHPLLVIAAWVLISQSVTGRRAL